MLPSVWSTVCPWIRDFFKCCPTREVIEPWTSLGGQNMLPLCHLTRGSNPSSLSRWGLSPVQPWVGKNMPLQHYLMWGLSPWLFGLAYILHHFTIPWDNWSLDLLLTYRQNVWKDIDKCRKSCYVKCCMCALPAIHKILCLLLGLNHMGYDVT